MVFDFPNVGYYLNVGQSDLKEKMNMTGTTCKACGTTQAILDNGNYFLGNNIEVQITETIELCVVCEIAGIPEEVGA